MIKLYIVALDVDQVDPLTQLDVTYDAMCWDRHSRSSRVAIYLDHDEAAEYKRELQVTRPDASYRIIETYINGSLYQETFGNG